MDPERPDSIIVSRDKVLAGSLAAILALVICRYTLVGFELKLRSLPTLAVVSFYDTLFVAGLCTVTVLLIYVTGGRTSVWLARAHLSLILVSVVLGLTNIKTVWNLGQPLTYSWLKYSDFLSGLDGQTAIKSEFTGRTLAYGAAVLGIFVAARFILFHLLRKVESSRGVRRHVLVLVIIPCVVYFPLAGRHLSHTDWTPDKIQNAAWGFARSCVLRNEFVAAQSSRRLAGSDAPSKPAGFSAVWDVAARPPRNLIFFVMESVGTKYLKLCDGAYDVTPTLSKYRQNAIQFERIYASVPQTDKTMVSLLCGIYPLPSPTSITKEYPNLDVASVTTLLRSKRYRTGWFHGGDLRFAGGDKFLANRVFDVIEDCRERQDRCPVTAAGGVDADGSCDECTVRSMVDWILADTNQPFFGVVWTAQTHVPYWICGGEQEEFGCVNRNLNRYLNAVKESDRAFSVLMSSLEGAHLVDDTLVVVVGDHGEVFDENRDLMGLHANHIYDGNIHVPCLFINSRLFHGQKSRSLGCLFDLPATALDILGLDTPRGWDGASLFRQNRLQGLYLHTSVGRELFGYMDDRTKWIYDAESRHWEVFDLRRDPEEQHNLASGREADCAAMKKFLIDWVGGQQEYVLRHSEIKVEALNR